MSSVTFTKQALTKATGKKLPDTLLREKMAMLGTPVDAISESTVTVELFPNRPDMLSLQGYARAFKSFLGLAPGMRKYKVLRGKTIVHVHHNLKFIRPYTACAVVRKLRLDEEKIRQIIDVQEKMHMTYGRKRKRCAIGIYPLKDIELPISFEARSPSDIVFTPLDGDKPLPALQILKEHPKGKEYSHLLFGFKEFPIFVDNAEAIMSLVPIINSKLTGRVTSETKEVFVEVSGHDFEICNKGLIMLCAMFSDMGAVVESVEINYGTKKIRTPDFAPAKMKLSVSKVNNLLGTKLTQKQVNAALRKMGYDVKGAVVIIPAYRIDILHETDLIEDIAIGYGYDNLVPTVPAITTIGKESRQATIERKLREVFVGMGFLEVKNFSLSSPKIQLENTYQLRRVVEMENPLTSDYSVLRHQLIPGLLETLSRNKHNEYPQLLFEIGPTWSPDEEPRLAFVVCSEKNAGFTEAKQIIEAMMRNLGKQLAVRPLEDKLFISGRAAVFPGGFFGEIHPQVLVNFEIPFSVAAGEIRFREIVE